MTGGGRQGRQDWKGGRRSGGGGGGGGGGSGGGSGGGGSGGRFRNDRRSGGFGGRDFEDRNRGGRWDGGGDMFEGRNMMSGGSPDDWNPGFRGPPLLPKGSEDYWEYRDIDDINPPQPAVESFEVEAKRQKLEVDDGLLPGIETVKSQTPAGGEASKNDPSVKKEAPKSLLDIDMQDVIDEYYEYFDGGPNISHKRARQLLEGIDAEEYGIDGFGGMGMNRMQQEQRVYKVVAGEYKFFDGPGPKSTELIKIGQDGRRVSPEEKLFIFVQFLLKTQFKKAPDLIMEDARNKMNSKQAIKIVYNIKPEEDDSGPYKCMFYVAGFKVVKVEASTKDEAKSLAAEKGLYTLLSKTFNEICPNNYFPQFDDGNYETKIRHRDDDDEDEDKDEDGEEKNEDGSKKSSDRNKDSRRRRGPTWRSPKLIIRLQVMKKVLTGTHPSNAYADMEAAAYTCQVALCIVCFKKTKLSGESDPMRCDMYADEMFLGSGSGANFQEAQQEVYKSARDNFLRTSVHSMLMNSKRLSELDRDDPNILDIVYRGHYQEIGSNNGSLKTYDIYPADLRKKVDSLVVFDFEEGQAKAPFPNLKSSATKSQMLFEWVLSSKDDKSSCRCLVYLQQKLIADVKGASKMAAKKAAAEQILTEFSDTHTLIQCGSVDYSNPAITLEALKQKAKDMCNDEGASMDTLTPKMHEILENIISEKIQEGSLEPIIFNEDISGDLRKFVKKYAESHKFPLMEKPADTKKHLILQKKMFTANDMLEILVLNDCINGKYKLMQKRDGDVLINYFDADGVTKYEDPKKINMSDLKAKNCVSGV